MGHSRSETLLFVQNVFSIANNIFLKTKFNNFGIFETDSKDNDFDTYEGYGNMLCKVVIEESSPLLKSSTPNRWTQKDLEEKLLDLPDRLSYCLAFYFTNLPITGNEFMGINGFAMKGGIFSEKKTLPNVGVVSFASCNSDPWTNCTLNFAHELGHSWGASHDIDEDSPNCISNINGSYLMSFPFLQQIGPNNFVCLFNNNYNCSFCPSLIIHFHLFFFSCFLNVP